MSSPIPRPLHVVNEGLAFLFEVLALAALCWWGFTTGSGVAVHVLLGLGAPVLAAALWGLFAAPRARFRVSLPAVLVVKAVVFAAATAALFGVGHPGMAIVFAILVVINTTIATIDRNALIVRSRG